jgi:hypothetical protein
LRDENPSYLQTMFWFIGSFLLLVWLIEKFLLNKGGFIHTLILAAIGCFAVQFVQDYRTRAYEREARHDKTH